MYYNTFIYHMRVSYLDFSIQALLYYYARIHALKSVSQNEFTIICDSFQSNNERIFCIGNWTRISCAPPRSMQRVYYFSLGNLNFILFTYWPCVCINIIYMNIWHVIWDLTNAHLLNSAYSEYTIIYVSTDETIIIIHYNILGTIFF